MHTLSQLKLQRPTETMSVSDGDVPPETGCRDKREDLTFFPSFVNTGGLRGAEMCACVCVCACTLVSSTCPHGSSDVLSGVF